MSAFYRCDAPCCGTEAEHPGFDTSNECILYPAGWKTGPGGDYCPKHDCRLRTGAWVWTEAQDDDPDDLCEVLDYDESLRVYVLTDALGEGTQTVPADDLEERNASNDSDWILR